MPKERMSSMSFSFEKNHFPALRIARSCCQRKLLPYLKWTSKKVKNFLHQRHQPYREGNINVCTNVIDNGKLPKTRKTFMAMTGAHQLHALLTRCLQTTNSVTSVNFMRIKWTLQSSLPISVEGRISFNWLKRKKQ